MENTGKRTTREVSPETKEKIRQSLKSYNSTHRRSPEWCRKLSDSNKAYWSKLPKKTTEIEDLI